MKEQKPPTKFRKLQSFKTEYAPAILTQYVSNRSGMHVIIADREGPKVNGYFTLATEIFDDSGAPHTLEHLVFMGSKNYRYKGLLDKLASRAYSNTNAWTATDHTAYTLETAGWDGFAQILPVYLEHVILPTMTDEGCHTEVHHIDGEGNDAGVVYSEMQAIQYTSGELMNLEARRIMYPENIGFRYETGGMMEALRTLTPARIREFHKSMYHPSNMCIVIVGETDHSQLLEILDEFEESIKDDINLGSPLKRPWIESAQPPPLKETVVKTVVFPEEDESIGEISVSYFGPNCNDVTQLTALNLLLTYLSGSSVSILENVMVEKEELASSITYWYDTRPNTCIWLQPTGVATEKLEFVYKRLIGLLKEVADGPWDMKYMNDIIKREKRQVQFSAETSEAFYSNNIITDYLFGHRNGSTLATLANLSEYDELEAWTEDQWKDFLKKWISDANHVAILGKPSEKYSKELKDRETERIAKRKEELGEEGLKALQKKLEHAKEVNDQPIPEEVLDRWPVPGTESIHFIKSETARSGKAKALGVESNAAQLAINGAKDTSSPLFIQFEDVATNFVHITIHIGTSHVPIHLKPLLPLFQDNFFNTPVLRDGKTLPFEELVKQLERDTVTYQIRSASRVVGDQEALAIELAVEPSKYQNAADWLKTLICDAVFDPVRLRAAVTKQLADVPESKRDGRSMSFEVDTALHYIRDSFSAAKRTLVKAVHYKRLKNRLSKEPDTVVSWFKELQASLFDPSNLRIVVTANVPKLEKPVATWEVLASALKPKIHDYEMMPIVQAANSLSEAGQKPGKEGVVLTPMATLDSSFSVSSASGLTSLTDPRLPALMVAIAYLETVEGPLWVATRGNGLAYGVSFGHDLDNGLLQFRVYRAPDAFKALHASGAKVLEICGTGKDGDNGGPLDRHLFEGAISQIVVTFADAADTMTRAALQNVVKGVIKGLPKGYDEGILAAVRAMSEEDVRKAMREIILPVFNPGTSDHVVTCATLTKDTMEEAFTKLGFKVRVQQLSDFYDDYGLEAQDGDEEGDDENDDIGSDASSVGATDSGGEESEED